MFTSFVVMTVAIILDTRKMWKSGSICIRRDEEPDILECMNPKSWFISNSLIVAETLCDENGKSKH
jgi:hypothetical protein